MLIFTTKGPSSRLKYNSALSTDGGLLNDFCSILFCINIYLRTMKGDVLLMRLAQNGRLTNLSVTQPSKTIKTAYANVNGRYFFTFK